MTLASLPQALPQPHLTDTVLMVRPEGFAFNAQTGADNEFQHTLDESSAVIRQRALDEFDAMVARLEAEGVRVLVLEKDPRGITPPDAVFPNNWFTTSASGEICIYPMLTPNRREERRVNCISRLLLDNQHQIEQIRWLGHPFKEDQILEGTGAMIFDHQASWVYAALSERCDEQLLDKFVKTSGLKGYTAFETCSSTGSAIYHTNVMMSIGEQFAVVCSESIVGEESRAALLTQLGKTHEVIEISLAQMEQSFCGNILNIRNQAGESLIVMSESAYNGFTEAQREQLSRYGRLISNPIPTIETIGGGSCRCMLAEIFLPRG